MAAKKKVKKPKVSKEVAPEAVAGNVKVVPCDSRKYLEVVDGCYIWIPLSDEERKVFVPNWSEATTPTWEIFLTEYNRTENNEPQSESSV